MDSSVVHAHSKYYNQELFPSFVFQKTVVTGDLLKSYEKQEKLNASFNVFARNCYTAYCGKNQASEQIDSPVQDLGVYTYFFNIIMINSVLIMFYVIKVYSEEGEELPLGSSFQHLVGMFFTSVKCFYNIENCIHDYLKFLYSIHVSESRYTRYHGEPLSPVVKPEAERLLAQLECVAYINIISSLIS